MRLSQAQPRQSEKERTLELRRLISGNQLDDMSTLSSFERHNRGRKFVVTCILVQKARGYKPRRVMNFHLCLSTPINSLWKAFRMKARSLRKVHGRERYARLGRRWSHDPQFDDQSKQHRHAKLHEERVNFSAKEAEFAHCVLPERCLDASRCRGDSRLVTTEKSGTRDTAVLFVFMNSDAVAKVPFCEGHPIRQKWSGKCFVILQSVDWVSLSLCWKRNTFALAQGSSHPC